ncbi:MAG: hypothetical protein BGO12_17070 [Verrucomicrobia bacterium 61-8]|nr:hypothetical protein [Verrucomicrobiota bacterium]OJV06338.1 MAG: hypothetical protein BGO12_17070 [Verrucomicrobia bacterium 61-8]
MPLGITEQIIFDHIKANRANREFWDGKIRQFRTEGKNENEVIAFWSMVFFRPQNVVIWHDGWVLLIKISLERDAKNSLSF